MFKDKVIIITGASEGIGLALAMALAEYHPKLVIAARNVQRLAELKQRLMMPDEDVLIQPVDVTNEQECKTLVEATVQYFGRVDYLVNNAGMTMWAMFEELNDLSVFNQIYQVNVMGAVYCTYYALPYLKQSKGVVVGISSLAGLNGVPSRSAYCASKHAMMGFFDSIRIELKDSDVSVVTVAPDFVVSQIHKRALDKDGNALERSPMQESKIMSAEDCAQIIIDAMVNKKRLAITSFRGKLARWLKLLAPGFIDNLAAKAIRDRK